MPNMKKHRMTDEISDTIRELLETIEQNALTQVHKTLLEEHDDYVRQQRRKRKALHKKLKEETDEAIKTLHKALDNSQGLVDINTSKVKKDVEKGTKMLIQSAMKHHNDSVKRINRLRSVSTLKESIYLQTQVGIDKGLKIPYKDGREMGYKEYMEMNVRTTIQHEIGETQLKFGAKAKVVFYICNVYGDCADDHADYQGKMYYDENWETFGFDEETSKLIRKTIRDKKMLSFQSVRENKPYLTTRPNCRHNLVAISIGQATGMSENRIIRDLGLKRGSYRDKNYEALQKQRYNERQIRFYKSRMDQNKELLKVDPDNELLKAKINKDNVMVRKWQKRQRDHIKANNFLERDYRRETKKVLLNDLGAKYNPKNRNV